VHLVHFNHFDTRRRADGLNRLAMRSNPVVHGDMATFQEPANGAEAQPLKVQLQGFALGRRAYPALLDSVPVPARLAFVPLFPFDYAVFAAICRTTLGAIHK